ncbi:MAG TPA: C-terminal binding protein, partial [Candidatus Methylomirabilis sp.]|nr:C-terminal binding protein [Candidatus Methylomirabilis sp.]
MGFLVVATDPHHSDFSEELKEFAAIGAEFRTAQCKTEDDVAKACRDADGILVTFSPIGHRALSAMRRCRIVVRTGVGYDTIDVPAATERRVMVANVPDYCISEVADHALALMLCLRRKVAELDAQVRSQGWTGMLRPVLRLEGQVLGIIGLGRIGRAVATRTWGFGLRRIAYDPYVPADVFSTLGVESVGLDVLARSADIITLHTPLTSETRGLMRKEIFRQMKPNAIIINTSRGGVVATDDLVQALQEGWISGAGLDVFEAEPLDGDHPLRHLPRVLLTPHAAWYSVDSEHELRRRSAHIVVQALQG